MGFGSKGDARPNATILIYEPWNVWGQVETARRLILSPGPHNEDDLKVRLQVLNHDMI